MTYSPLPRTLAQVATAATDAEFVSMLKEFVDVLLGHAKANGFAFDRDLPLLDDAIDAVPVDYPSRKSRAYICAMAEHLAYMAGRPAPEWSKDPLGFLEEPWFGGGTHSRPFMLKDTPLAFRRRLVFLGPALLRLETLRKKAA